MRVGNLIAPFVYALPGNTTLPIVSGPLRGSKWILSSQTANFWYGTFEKEKVHRYVSFLKPGTVVYDVGANVGYYTLISAARAAHVYAFEPVPTIANLLERHLTLNHVRNCTLTRVAVGAGPGETRFTPATGRNNGSGHFSTDGPLTVKITSLDEFSRNHPLPNLIKIDIEGAEVMALQGASRTLSAGRPVIFLATHENAGPECLALLRSHGYKIEMLAEDEIVATP